MSTTTALRRRLSALGLPGLLAAIAGLLVLAFCWPAATAEPRDLPVAIAGPAPAVDQLREEMSVHVGDAVALTEADDRAAAIELIERREAYGAILLGDRPEVLIASAAGPAVSQMLGQMAGELEAALSAQLQAAGGAAGAPPVEVTVTDLAPLVAADSRGALIASVSFPLVIASVAAGALTVLLVGTPWRRAATLAGFAPVAGLAVAAILQGWFGALQGDYLANSAALALAVGAGALTIAGLSSLLGHAGIPIGVVLLMLVGNPISAANQPLEFLPEPWGAVGQLLPPGAAATLVRNLSYFPEADLTQPLLVLGCWVAAGAALIAVGTLRGRRPVAAARPVTA